MTRFGKQILITCLLAATILPGCSPAAIPIPKNFPAKTKEPCVNISVSATTLKVGETITITGTAEKVEIPLFFGLQILDGGDFSMMLNMPASGATQAMDVSQILKFVSANYADHGRVVVLRANQAGSTKVAFFVSGDSGCADPSKGGATSNIIIITVNP